MGASVRVRGTAWWFVTICGLLLLALSTLAGKKLDPDRGPALGGARGVLHGERGEPVEGVGVQLISTKTAIRTTVYANEEGRFEFPVLPAGAYTLRIPRPMEFKPYVREGVQIEGATELPDINLKRIGDTEFLPPTPETMAQLTGAEWMMNLEGTGEEKRVFTVGCGFGCHSYQQIFRNRYDERSWKLILERMIRSGSSPLIRDTKPTPTTKDRMGRLMLEDEAFLAKWLARVRGPESKDPPLYYLPRERGRSTRVIVTEYELPREILAPHDVHGDSKGNIWWTAHRSAYSGVLDPRTGVVTQYRIPEKEKDTVGAIPGTHRVFVDKNDIVWFWEGWDNYLTGLDAKTGKIVKRYSRGGEENLNSPGGEGGPNFAMDAAGFIYQTHRGQVIKTDTRTGEIVQRYPLKKIQGTYDSTVTADGRYWAGGLGYLDMKTGESWEPEISPEIVSPARGGFDPFNNAWFGGRGGMLLKHDGKTHRISQYFPPIPWETFYEAMPDKNGEVWAGGLQSGRMWRFNPNTRLWTGYMMPEPYAHDRRTWIDNSTTPVTVWFVDQDGYMVRVQPLD
jgi:streptogramin lyase